MSTSNDPSKPKTESKAGDVCIYVDGKKVDELPMDWLKLSGLMMNQATHEGKVSLSTAVTVEQKASIDAGRLVCEYLRYRKGSVPQIKVPAPARCWGDLFIGGISEWEKTFVSNLKTFEASTLITIANKWDIQSLMTLCMGHILFGIVQCPKENYSGHRHRTVSECMLCAVRVKNIQNNA